MKDRILGMLPGRLALMVQRGIQRGTACLVNAPAELAQKPGRMWRGRDSWRREHFVNLPNAILLFWLVLLVWGERWVFERGMRECEWENWEPWVS